MIKMFASMPVLIALCVAAHALPSSDTAPDNSARAEYTLKPASDAGPLQRFAQDERQKAIQRAIQQRQQQQQQQQNQQRAIQQQQMQQRGVQQQQQMQQQRAIQQQQMQQRAIQQQQIQQRANQQQQQIQQQRANQQQQFQQRAIQEQKANQQRALQQQQIQQQAIQQRAIQQQQLQQRGIQQQQFQQRGIQQQAIQQNAAQQRMLQQQQAVQQRALQQQMMQQRINAARITRGPGQIAVGRPNYTNLQLARLNAGRIAPIYRAPRRYWYGGGWRTYVPLAALGAVAVGGAYLYADAYVPVGRRYCEGVTSDGCQLNWQMVEFEGGGSDWQCVQYCPRAGALPPPRTVALTAPPPLPAEGKCEISLYAGPNFSNGPITTSEDQPQLSASGWRNQIASLQIAAGTWDVFTDEQFGGESVRLEPGDYPNLPPEFERNIGSFTCVQPSP